LEELDIPSETKLRLAFELKKFSKPDHTGGSRPYSAQLRLPGEELPDPALLHFLLVDAMSFEDFGKSEKSAWWIPFRFESIPAALVYQKFGLVLYLSPSPSLASPAELIDFSRRLCGKLIKGVKIIENGVLKKFAREQVQAGNVLIVNQYRSLWERYLYFRERARISYDGSNLLPNNSGKVEPSLVLVRNFMNERVEGSHNALAMVNAAFSAIEHALVLALPFTDSARRVSVRDLIRERWSGKFKCIYDVGKDTTAHHYYRRLNDAAEEWRNPYSHGGFDKVGGGVYVHFRRVGVVPAALTNVHVDPQLSFMPTQQDDFTALCTLFDGVEKFMKVHPTTRLPMRYIEGGLNVSYDRKSIDKYAAALSSDEAFDNFCEHQAHLEDMYANMDW
jgi:hypothetical protein